MSENNEKNTNAVKPLPPEPLKLNTVTIVESHSKKSPKNSHKNIKK